MSKKWVQMGSTWTSASVAEDEKDGGPEVEEAEDNHTLVAYDNAYQNNQQSLNDSVVRSQFNIHKRIVEEFGQVYNNFEDVKAKFKTTDKERAEFEEKTRSQFADLESKLSKQFQKYDSEIRSVKTTIKGQKQQFDKATASLEGKVGKVVSELQHRGENIFSPDKRTVSKIDLNNN